jgi:hypothetical protein
VRPASRRATQWAAAFSISRLATATYTITETVDGFTPVGSDTVVVTLAAGETKPAAFVNQVCGLIAAPNTIKVNGSGKPNPSGQKLTVKTDGVCAGPVTVVFDAGTPGPSAPLTLAAGSPSGTGPFTYTTGNVPDSPKWSKGVATGTVKSGGTTVGTIQVTVS